VTDERIERLIGGWLRVGVILSACVTLAGGIWHAIRSGGAPLAYRIFRGEPAELRSVTGVLTGIRDGHPEALIQLGLLLLVATPIARVALSVVAFALERDWLYAAITLLVFALLVTSITGLMASH
jgi:uncharacterized membrane protein